MILEYLDSNFRSKIAFQLYSFECSHPSCVNPGFTELASVFGFYPMHAISQKKSERNLSVERTF